MQKRNEYQLRQIVLRWASRETTSASLRVRLEWWAWMCHRRGPRLNRLSRMPITTFNPRIILPCRSTAVSYCNGEKSNHVSAVLFCLHSCPERQRPSNSTDRIFQLVFPGKLRCISKLFHRHSRPGRTRSFPSRIAQRCLSWSAPNAKCRLWIFLAPPAPDLHPSWSKCIDASVLLRDLLQRQTDRLLAGGLHRLPVGYHLGNEQSKVNVDEHSRSNYFFYSTGWRNGGVTPSQLRRSLIFPFKNAPAWLESCLTRH